MGATRLPSTSDALYELRHAKYLARRTTILAQARDKYQQIKEQRCAALRAVTATAREARLLEKRRILYGPDVTKWPLGTTVRLKQFLLDYKKDKPCFDCGIAYPPFVMDFDHVRGAKHRDVSDCRTLKSMKAEILKCDLVCANCHRVRTFTRPASSAE